jgi:hypothetical protein
MDMLGLRTEREHDRADSETAQPCSTMPNSKIRWRLSRDAAAVTLDALGAHGRVPLRKFNLLGGSERGRGFFGIDRRWHLVVTRHSAKTYGKLKDICNDLNEISRAPVRSPRKAWQGFGKRAL